MIDYLVLETHGVPEHFAAFYLIAFKRYRRAQVVCVRVMLAASVGSKQYRVS